MARLQLVYQHLKFINRYYPYTLGVAVGGLVLFFGANAILGNASSSHTTQRPTEFNALPVEVFVAEPVEAFDVLRDYTGEIIAGRTSELGFERTGTLTQLTVDEGTRVQAGDILSQLDVRNLEADIRQLDAQVAQADAQLREMRAGPRSETIAAARSAARDLEVQLHLASEKLTRRQNLFEQGAISREQYDEAISDVSILQARWNEAKSQLGELLEGTRSEQIDGQLAAIAQLQAQLDRLQLERQRSTLIAPFSGTISASHVDEGAVVSAGTPVLRLVEDGILEAHVGVPASATRSLQPGSLHPVEIDTITVTARVDAVLPELDPATRTVTVILKLEDAPTALVFPGQLARLQVPERIDETGFWLPTHALVQGVRGLWSCYVLGVRTTVSASDDAIYDVEQRDIEILHVEGERVLVRGTLQLGDRIVSNSSHRLTLGQRVHPVNMSLVHETIQSETVQSETVRPETMQSETMQSETVQPETLQSETVQSHSMPPNAGILP